MEFERKIQTRNFDIDQHRIPALFQVVHGTTKLQGLVKFG